MAEPGVRLDCKCTLKKQYVETIKSQIEIVAQSAGVNVRTINTILEQHETSFAIAKKISSSFNVPYSKLFDIVEIEQGLSPKTILHHHRLISAILNKAVKWQILLSNPASRVEIPKVKQTEAHYYDDEQVIHLFKLLTNEPLKYQAAIYIALYGGLRLGEVTGLEWGDINFDEKSLYISKARQYVSGLGTYDKEPKTERSIRHIQLSNGVLNILEKYKREQAQERLRLGSKWVDSGKIFTQWNGLPMFPQTPSQWFNKWLKKSELPKITFHQLRHSHTSILIANGVDIATVSKRLGHSKISTTIDVYTHAIKSKDTIAANLLDDIITKR